MNEVLHKKYLIDILQEIYKNPFLAQNLYFKGGTALFLFYDLPRFSTDLDFDMKNECREREKIFDEIKKILLKFGEIRDSAIKRLGMLLVLSYAKYERLLKVEISTRNSEIEDCETKNIFGTDIKLMKLEYMCANKLMALLERKKARDLFDAYFILQNGLPINEKIIHIRTGLNIKKFWKSLKLKIKKEFSRKNVLHELGEMVDARKKDWIREKLISEVVKLIDKKLKVEK